MPYIAKHIKQIIPAKDWWAVYAGDESERCHYAPIACWALVWESVENPETDCFVAGIDGVDTLEVCEESSNFLGYVHTADRANKEGFFEEEAAEWRTQEASRRTKG